MSGSGRNINRRQFIHRSVRGAGLCALSGAALAAAPSASRAAEQSANAFAAEVDRLARTDPKLVGYEQFRRFSGLHLSPRRIAIGPGDRVYVATRNGVDVMDAQGARLEGIALTAPARCVAVAADGTVYVGLRDRVEVFDPKGQSQANWVPPTKKTWFTGLAVGDTDVFAADSANRVILRYDRSGKLVARLGEKNLERNIPALIVPSPYLDVKLARDGLLRVNNPGRHSVEVFTVNGELEFSWGKPSAGIEGFCGCCNPIGLALLADGRCITCEKGLPRVKVYSADKILDCVVAGPEAFPENARSGSAHEISDGIMGGLDAAVDSQGHIYILDLVVGDVLVMKRKA